MFYQYFCSDANQNQSAKKLHAEIEPFPEEDTDEATRQ